MIQFYKMITDRFNGQCCMGHAFMAWARAPARRRALGGFFASYFPTRKSNENDYAHMRLGCGTACSVYYSSLVLILFPGPEN